MRIVRFNSANGKTLYGVLEENTVYEIKGSIFKKYEKTDNTYKLSEIKLLTPCIPGKIFCIGLNYIDHIKELGYETPVKPAGFIKPLSSVVNPGDNIVIPTMAEQVDYEGELAIVVKEKAKNVSAREAKKYILGVTPLNDVTERKLSFTPSLVTFSKSFDTFTTFGPVIDTDIDPDNATVRTYLNGKLVQDGHTKGMVFSPSELVAFLTQGTTFYPGDIISTGTPFGVQPIKHNDKVEVEIKGMPNRLINYVYDPKAVIK
jgi:2-keto-4-pentenoate hydratase/2-oxohepta-3-ene-1,7-dioic acid hydratase in catechol pathway